jgi:hypothetical protein
MKRLYLFFFFVSTSLAVFSQAGDQAIEKKKPLGIHIGITYNYLSADMKLGYMSLHSIYNGQDFGTETLTKKEIDTINSFMKYNNTLTVLAVEAGMKLLDKPGAHWKIDGKLMFGISKSYRSAHNTNIAGDEQVFSTDFFRPCTGIGFTFTYNFNPHWGLSMLPYSSIGWGISNKVDDNLYPKVEYFEESRKESFTTVYSRFTVLAAYSIWHLTISLGPGVYYQYDTHTYKIDRTNPDNGSTFHDDIKTRLHNRSFLDGCLSAQWRIIQALTLDASCYLGHDLLIHGGICYNF